MDILYSDRYKFTFNCFHLSLLVQHRSTCSRKDNYCSLFTGDIRTSSLVRYFSADNCIDQLRFTRHHGNKHGKTTIYFPRACVLNCCANTIYYRSEKSQTDNNIKLQTLTWIPKQNEWELLNKLEFGIRLNRKD